MLMLLWMIMVSPVCGWTVLLEALPPPPNNPSPSSQLSASVSLWISSQDRIARVLDDNTIKLQESGVVTLKDTKLPVVGSGYQFPSCLETTPNTKLKQLLPAKSIVDVQKVDGTKNSVILYKDGMSINEQLVRTGYAKARNSADDRLKQLQMEAETKQLGLFRNCDSYFVGDVESIKTMEDSTKQSIPPNPGDTVGCSDFGFYEDALKYYETYWPYYGDVAMLDRDHDGVPCPKLPHTNNPELYRIKKKGIAGR